MAKQRRVAAEVELKAAQIAEKQASDDLGHACTRRRDCQLKIASFSDQIAKLHQLAANIKTAATKG
jgi:hypothetical protein